VGAIEFLADHAQLSLLEFTDSKAAPATGRADYRRVYSQISRRGQIDSAATSTSSRRGRHWAPLVQFNHGVAVEMLGALRLPQASSSTHGNVQESVRTPI
jgi:hypothetical protein